MGITFNDDILYLFTLYYLTYVGSNVDANKLRFITEYTHHVGANKTSINIEEVTYNVANKLIVTNN